MSRDEFEALVKKVEAIWQADPKRYMTRVVALLVLVYGFLALMLLGSLVGLAGCIALVFAVLQLAPVAVRERLGDRVREIVHARTGIELVPEVRHRSGQ